MTPSSQCSACRKIFTQHPSPSLGITKQQVRMLRTAMTCFLVFSAVYELAVNGEIDDLPSLCEAATVNHLLGKALIRIIKGLK